MRPAIRLGPGAQPLALTRHGNISLHRALVPCALGLYILLAPERKGAALSKGPSNMGLGPRVIGRPAPYNV